MSAVSPPSPAPASNPPRGSRSPAGVVVPHAPKWYQRVAAFLVFASIKTLAFTLRYRWQAGSKDYLNSANGPAIYCVWHNRLALVLPIYYAQAQKVVPTAGMAAMCSASKDGAFLAAILDWFRVQPVRGSSSRRGRQALLELTSWAERGYDLAITPDGPRGPRYVVQPGVTSLAQITGLPIVGFSYNLSRKICVRSWDRFQIPVPFAVCEMVVGKVIRVPRDATDEQREALRQELENALRAISRD